MPCAVRSRSDSELRSISNRQGIPGRWIGASSLGARADCPIRELLPDRFCKLLAERTSDLVCQSRPDGVEKGGPLFGRKRSQSGGGVSKPVCKLFPHILSQPLIDEIANGGSLFGCQLGLARPLHVPKSLCQGLAQPAPEVPRGRHPQVAP